MENALIAMVYSVTTPRRPVAPSPRRSRAPDPATDSRDSSANRIMIPAVPSVELRPITSSVAPWKESTAGTSGLGRATCPNRRSIATDERSLRSVASLIVALTSWRQLGRGQRRTAPYDSTSSANSADHPPTRFPGQEARPRDLQKTSLQVRRPLTTSDLKRRTL